MWEEMKVGAEKKNRRVIPLAARILNKHTHTQTGSREGEPGTGKGQSHKVGQVRKAAEGEGGPPENRHLKVSGLL